MCLHTAHMPIVSAPLYLDTGVKNRTPFSCLSLSYTIAYGKNGSKKKAYIVTSSFITGLLLETPGSLSGRRLPKETRTGPRWNLKPWDLIHLKIAGFLSDEEPTGGQPWGYSCSKV